MVLLPPGLAAFQNCFCAEYLFIGHSLKRQSEGDKKEKKRLVAFVIQTSSFKTGLKNKIRGFIERKCVAHNIIHKTKLTLCLDMYIGLAC